MEQLRKDEKYNLAVQSINSELTINDTLKRTTGTFGFPEHLKLYHLPSTVMPYYSKEEKNMLFSTEESTNEITSIVNQIRTTVNNLSSPVPTDDSLVGIAQVIVRVTTDSTEAKMV